MSLSDLELHGDSDTTATGPLTVTDGFGLYARSTMTATGALTVSNSIFVDGPATTLDHAGSLTITGGAFIGDGAELTGGGNTTVDYLSAFGATLGDGGTTITGDAQGDSSFLFGLRVDGQTLVNEAQLDFRNLTGTNGARLENFGTLVGNGSDFATPPSADPATLINEPGGSMTQDAHEFGDPSPVTNFVDWNFDNSGSVQSGAYEFAGGGSGGSATPASASYDGANPAAPFSKVCLGGDPVVCATGDQIEHQVDLSVGGFAGPLQLARTYNSQLAASQTTPGPFGYGWTSSFDAHLFVSASNHAALVEQTNGSTVAFSVASDGSFVPGQGVEATLAQNPDGSYTYELPNRQVLQFDSSGRLAGEISRAGNTLSLAYNGQSQLSSVTAPSGRQITFNYNGQGLVASATDPSGLTIRYSYDTKNNLTSVSDSSGMSTTRWRFGYDGEHELTSIADARGNASSISYEALQVVQQTDPLDRTTTWAYTPDQTLITSPAGNVTQELFDADHEPIAITSGYGTSAQSTETTT